MIAKDIAAVEVMMIFLLIRMRYCFYECVKKARSGSILFRKFFNVACTMISSGFVTFPEFGEGRG